MALNQASLVSRKCPCFDVSRQIRILKLEKKVMFVDQLCHLSGSQKLN